MSTHHEEKLNPVNALIGKIFMVIFTLSLVIMLGYVGASFLKGAGYRPAPPAPVAAVAEATPLDPDNKVESPMPKPAAKGEAPAEANPATQATAAAVVAPTEEQMAAGQTSYAMCGACHGPTGTGLPVGPMMMAPSFVGSKVLLGNDEAPIAAVLKGIHKEADSGYVGAMMPLGTMTDDQIASVITYIRNSFGNKGNAVTPEKVAEVRAKYATVDAPTGLKRAELEKIAGVE